MNLDGCSIRFSLRLFDVSLALLGLLVSLPISFLVYLLAFIDTGSPLFFQERLGISKRPFILVKFRTMPVDTVSKATHLNNSLSISKVGHFLRAWKLDELPQLWNVLLGDMSMVGPRPGLANQLELTAAREKLQVFSVRPGITGLAQISGIDMSTPAVLARADAEMIKTMSIRKYAEYILLTAAGRGLGVRPTKK